MHAVLDGLELDDTRKNTGLRSRKAESLRHVERRTIAELLPAGALSVVRDRVAAQRMAAARRHRQPNGGSDRRPRAVHLRLDGEVGAFLDLGRTQHPDDGRPRRRGLVVVQDGQRRVLGVGHARNAADDARQRDRPIVLLHRVVRRGERQVRGGVGASRRHGQRRSAQRVPGRRRRRDRHRDGAGRRLVQTEADRGLPSLRDGKRVHCEGDDRDAGGIGVRKHGKPLAEEDVRVLRVRGVHRRGAAQEVVHDPYGSGESRIGRVALQRKGRQPRHRRRREARAGVGPGAQDAVGADGVDAGEVRFDPQVGSRPDGAEVLEEPHEAPPRPLLHAHRADRQHARVGALGGIARTGEVAVKRVARRVALRVLDHRAEARRRVERVELQPRRIVARHLLSQEVLTVRDVLDRHAVLPEPQHLLARDHAEARRHRVIGKAELAVSLVLPVVAASRAEKRLAADVAAAVEVDVEIRRRAPSPRALPAQLHEPTERRGLVVEIEAGIDGRPGTEVQIALRRRAVALQDVHELGVEVAPGGGVHVARGSDEGDALPNGNVDAAHRTSREGRLTGARTVPAKAHRRVHHPHAVVGHPVDDFVQAVARIAGVLKVGDVQGYVRSHAQQVLGNPRAVILFSPRAQREVGRAHRLGAVAVAVRRVAAELRRRLELRRHLAAETGEADIHDADANSGAGVTRVVPGGRAHDVRRTVGEVDARRIRRLRGVPRRLHAGVANARVPRQLGEEGRRHGGGNLAGEEIARLADDHLAQPAAARRDPGADLGQALAVVDVDGERHEAARGRALSGGRGRGLRGDRRPRLVIARRLTQQRSEVLVGALRRQRQGGGQEQQDAQRRRPAGAGAALEPGQPQPASTLHGITAPAPFRDAARPRRHPRDPLGGGRRNPIGGGRSGSAPTAGSAWLAGPAGDARWARGATRSRM